LSRHRLDFGSIGEVKLAHLKHVGTRKPAAKSRRQVPGEQFHNALTVASPLSSALLLLKNSFPDPPVRYCHQRVDSPASLLTRLFQPLGYINQ
jgi:hypothetical protein